MSIISQVNLNNGGEIPVTELIDGVYRASFLQKESMNRLLTKLMPDAIENEENEAQKRQMLLDFSIVKMCARIFKMGKDRTYIF